MEKLEATMAQIEQLAKRKLYALAVEQTLDAIESAPGNIDLKVNLAQIYYQAQVYISAVGAIQDVLRHVPDSPELLHRAALYAITVGMADWELEVATQSVSLPGSKSVTWQLIANIHEKSGDDELAAEALSHVPDDDEHYEVNCATEARILYSRKQYSESIDILKQYFEWAEKRSTAKELTSNNQYIDNWFLLVKIYNKIGEYDLAWESATQAHERAGQRWDQAKFDRQSEHIRATFSKENLRALAHSEAPYEQPVFIVGNARSGTSLLEQILSMHPDVGNGGELIVTGTIQRSMPQAMDSFNPYPDCIYDMRVEDANAFAMQYQNATDWFSTGKKRVTNKAMGLQSQVGLLSLILPKSRAIMLHRHPLDNCLSCFTTNLVHSGHGYTKTIETLGQTWLTRRAMQDFWTEVVEIPVMDLHYDELVVNQEHETRRLIEFLDLPWNDECLNFHKSRRVAATISYDQVNQKMYTSSSGRWKNYEKHLGPLIDIVGDYI
ncbi:MAG: sulfotransferase [Phycisphaerales bacterium]|nr:sulfotransferase [Phycisphaerales bacterium]